MHFKMKGLTKCFSYSLFSLKCHRKNFPIFQLRTFLYKICNTLTLNEFVVGRTRIVFLTVRIPAVTRCLAGCNRPVLPSSTNTIMTTIRSTIKPVEVDISYD